MQHHGERHPRTFDDHTLECNVRSERVKGSDLDVRPLCDKQMCERVRSCVDGLGCRQGQGTPLPRTHARARVRALRGASTTARMRRIAREPLGPWRKLRAEIEGQHARHSTSVDRRHLNSRRARGCTRGSAAAIGSGEHTVCQCRTARQALTHAAIAPPPSACACRVPRRERSCERTAWRTHSAHSPKHISLRVNSSIACWALGTHVKYRPTRT